MTDTTGMYDPLRLLGEFDWEQPIWRYLTTDRFVALTSQSQIYFASARQFSDPFEGAVAVVSPDFPVDPRYSEMGSTDRAFYALTEYAKISCWHRSPHESTAMWDLYAAQAKGVVICSTPRRIAQALKPFCLLPKSLPETLLLGNVTYVDLQAERLRIGTEERFFIKHLPFAWEQEFRVAVSLRLASEYGVPTPELGVNISVDVATLVDHVIVGPKLAVSEREGIVAHARKLTLPVRLSCLLGTPRYH